MAINLTERSSATQAEILTIRYLGWLAENLSGNFFKGEPSPLDIRAAHQCCDRIEHITQYIIEGLDWSDRAQMLAADVEFMRGILESHAAKAGIGQTECVPTYRQLDALQSAITE